MFLGIDQSLTHTGLVLLKDDGSLELAQTVNTEMKKAGLDLKGVARLDFIATRICELVAVYGGSKTVMDVGMEDYAFSGNNLCKLGELGGVIKHQLYQRYNIFPRIIHNTKIKKWATEKGNADKNLVMLGTYKKYGIDLKNDNEYDALNIAKIMYWLKQVEVKGEKETRKLLKKYEWDVLKAMKDDAC